MKTKEEKLEYQRTYYRNNKEKLKKYRKEYLAIKENREYHNTYTKEFHRGKRIEAVQVLGGKCVECGITDTRCLQIDHIHGGGVKELFTQRSYKYYNWIINNPKMVKKKYQILCANHNWIKRFENGEHK